MSDCVCLYGGYDADDAEFQCATTPVARVEHRCAECRRTIARGEHYERYVTKHDGEISVSKSCAQCAEIRRALYCEGFYFGCLWEDVKDQIFESGKMNSACLDKLSTVEAKQFLQRQWMEWVNEQAAKRADQIARSIAKDFIS